MFYSSTIMVSSGLPPNVITALVGTVNCLSVFPTIWLFKMFGRKTILWTLSFAITCSLVGLGVCQILNDSNPTAAYQDLSIVFLMLFIVFFEFSLGPLLWIYMSEIMTEKGLSLGAGLNWIMTVCFALFT
jgi:SP family facilitated glucose transporter-like MFS transporter 1